MHWVGSWEYGINRIHALYIGVQSLLEGDKPSSKCNHVPLWKLRGIQDMVGTQRRERWTTDSRDDPAGREVGKASLET